jgi:hypothetical protein
MVYIPDGFTKESYAKFKEEQHKKIAKKNLGGVGPKRFMINAILPRSIRTKGGRTFITGERC